MLANGHDTFKTAFLNGFKPKEILTVSQWADKYRILPRKTSSEPGRWRTDRTPYLKEIMDELSHMSPVKKVVFMKGAQVGATECGNNWMGYTIDYDPCTMMTVWPSLPDVKKNSKLRVDPLIEGTPQLKEKISSGKSKDSKNTTLFKDFDGGALILSGANSASGLRSVPAKKLFLDEIDAYPLDVEGEGDPISLVLVRSRTFSKRKAFIVSTPTFKGISKIEKEFNASDQRYFYVPCPHCNEKQILKWDNFHYETEHTEEKEKVISASYFCEHCGEEIQEHFKTKMLMAGEWIAHNPKSETAGFHLSSFYSPLGWYSWIEVCQDYVDALDDHEKMVAWVNTAKGETFEETGEKPKFDSLYSRRENYKIGTVPKGVVFLTCAVDVQGDRLEAEVHGWGRKKEKWSIDHQVIPGAPDDEKTWDDLEQYIMSTFPREDGPVLPIRLTAIDSGYATQDVYNFVRKFDQRRVIAIKGDSNIAQMVGKPKHVDVKENGKVVKRRGVKLWPLGTNVIKSEIYGGLQKETPENPEDGYPSGFTHFPEYEMEYFKQLTAEERRVSRNKKGYTVIEWVKIRERNEILDLHVYNRAAASIVGIDRLTDKGWEKLEAKINVVENFKKDDNKKVESPKKAKTKERSKKKKRGFW